MGGVCNPNRRMANAMQTYAWVYLAHPVIMVCLPEHCYECIGAGGMGARVGQFSQG